MNIPVTEKTITTAEARARLETVNPIASPKDADDTTTRFPPSPRLSKLEGKTIGLFWNGKALGNVALERVEQQLAKRYKTARFIHYIGVNGPQLRRATPAQLDQIARECDAVVGASADCGSCCSWLIHEMCELERRGVPAVAITAEGFEEDAHWSAKIFGCPEVQLMVTPLAITSQPVELIHEMIDGAIDKLIVGLTVKTYEPEGEFAHHVRVTDPATFSYEGADLLDCFDRMNAQFIEKGWSDGLPLVPPTPDKVAAMVAASGRAADEVVGIFEPGFGVGTVEKIAANAVMAGCRPEAMPVVLAVAEALLVPRYGLRCLAMSTGPQHPLIVVSGPYAKAIGMNSGCCALGPGSLSAVNVAIGRSSRLIMMNVGLSYPAVSDMDTIGSTGKFGACVAENEARTPWRPLRVQKGFDAVSTTVTLHAPYAVSDVTDFYNSTPEAVVESFCKAARNAAVTGCAVWLVNTSVGDDVEGPFHGDWDPMVMLSPDHADVFKNAGWSDDQVRKAIFKGARVPFREAMHSEPPELFEKSNPHLQWLWDNPDTPVSIYKNPEQIDLVVVGQDAPRSLFWYGGTASTTVEVKIP